MSEFNSQNIENPNKLGLKDDCGILSLEQRIFNLKKEIFDEEEETKDNERDYLVFKETPNYSQEHLDQLKKEIDSAKVHLEFLKNKLKNIEKTPSVVNLDIMEKNDDGSIYNPN